MTAWRDLTQDAWLVALADPRHRVIADLAATASPYRKRGPWSTRTITLTEHLLYLVLGDPVVLTLAGTTRELVAGTFLCVPPGVAFCVSLAAGANSVYLQRIRLRLEAPRTQWRLAGGPLAIPEAWSLETRFADLVRESENAAGHHDLLINAHAAVLFAEAFRLQQAKREDGKVLSATQRMRLRQVVRQALPRWLTPADLADEMGLTHDYFTRVFRRTFGVAPRTWLMSERLRTASELLAGSEASIGDIAAQVGYRDRNLFGRQFAALIGSTPRTWRAGRKA